MYTNIQYVYMNKSATFRFRDFLIYKNAKEFRRAVLPLLKKFPAHQRFELCKQIDRASYSIILNIAEGSARTSDGDFRHFLTIAIASLNEVIAGFDCALDEQYITSQDMQSIEQKAEPLARQIGSFIKKLTANC